MLDLCCCLVANLFPILCDPMDCGPWAPLSMGYSRQEYWSGLPFPSLGYCLKPGTETVSPALKVCLYQLNHQGSPDKLRHFLLLTDYLVTSRYLLHIFCKNLIKFFIIRTSVVCRFMPCIWCSFVLFLRCVSISSLMFILAMAFWN